ncbi:MAG: hypothetical protein RL291_378 [Pseudomonadota bacterium]
MAVEQQQRAETGRGRLRPARWMAVAGALLATAAQASDPPARLIPIATFGADDRVAVPQNLSKVPDALGVLFNTKAKTVCTAFCAGDDIVGTAAHCLYRTTGERTPQLADFWFARSYDTIRDYARIKGHDNGTAAYNVLSGTLKLKIQPPIDATSDWAFVKLAKPLCAKGQLTIEAMTPDAIEAAAKDKKVFQISYHRDFLQWQPAYSQPCTVTRNYEGAPWEMIREDFSNPETLVLHTCDTGGASSGSPLFMDTPKGPVVIAINVGTYVQSKVLMRDGQVAQRLKADTVANTAVSTSRFHEQLKLFRSTQPVAGTRQVRQIQERLKALKFYDGPADGALGPQLRAAIEAYETAKGTPRLGLPTEALIKQLGITAAR